MNHLLTPAERAAYHDEGYFVRAAVFSPEECAALSRAAERAVRRAQALAEAGRAYRLDGHRFVDAGCVTMQFEHRTDSATVRVIEPVNELDPCFDALIDDARLVEPMRDLIGTAVVALWTSKLNLKRPFEGSGFRWHQDSPYWIHDCDHVDLLPNAMLAIDPASTSNGCLEVIRGSHRHGRLPGTADGSQLGGFFTAAEAFDLAARVALEVPAGSLIFFSPHIVHGSQPNASPMPRRALVVTYQPGGRPALKSRRIRDATASAPRVASYGSGEEA